jgi:hypothetical protein
MNLLGHFLLIDDSFHVIANDSLNIIHYFRKSIKESLFLFLVESKQFSKFLEL